MPGSQLLTWLIIRAAASCLRYVVTPVLSRGTRPREVESLNSDSAAQLWVRPVRLAEPRLPAARASRLTGVCLRTTTAVSLALLLGSHPSSVLPISRRQVLFRSQSAVAAVVSLASPPRNHPAAERHLAPFGPPTRSPFPPLWPRSSSAGPRRPAFSNRPLRPTPFQRHPRLAARGTVPPRPLARPALHLRPRRRSQPSPGARDARVRAALVPEARAQAVRRVLQCLTVRPRVGGRRASRRRFGVFWLA